MIQTDQIRDEIIRLLAGLKPEAVYINLCPTDFKRPSYCLETKKIKTANVNFSTEKVKAFFTITCFVKLDGSGKADAADLTKAQDDVARLFRGGYIEVENRALAVKVSRAGHDTDRSCVDLKFKYFDNRLDTADDTPPAEHLETNMQVK